MQQEASRHIDGLAHEADIDTAELASAELERLLCPRLDDALAVVPPTVTGEQAHGPLVANLIAEVLINTLGGSSQLKVLSHRSTHRLRSSEQPLQDAGQQLQAAYVLSGKAVLGLHNRVTLHLLLQSPTQGRLLWSDRIEFHVQDLLCGETEVLVQACIQVHSVLQRGRLKSVNAVDWRSLSHYELQCVATQQLYRLSPSAFEQARRLLHWLTEQAPHLAEPHAWLAKWHLLAMAQGLSPQAVSQKALRLACDEALRRDSACALALSLQGHALASQAGAEAEALSSHEAALAAAPNNALSWAFLALNRVYADQPVNALEAVRMALGLSPLDPWRHFLDSAMAHACLAGGQPATALKHAQQAQRLRADHTPNWLYLAVAHQQLGDLPAAQQAAQQLLNRWKGYTVSNFRRTYWGRNTTHAEAFALALQNAGVPA